MKTVTAATAATNFSSLLQEAIKSGEEVSIMKNHRLIARLVPANTTGREKFEQAVEELIEFSESNFSGGGLDWKELRDEGRKR